MAMTKITLFLWKKSRNFFRFIMVSGNHNNKKLVFTSLRRWLRPISKNQIFFVIWAQIWQYSIYIKKYFSIMNFMLNRFDHFSKLITNRRLKKINLQIL